MEGVSEDFGVPGREGEGEEGKKGVQHLELLGRRTVEFSLLEGSAQNLVNKGRITCAHSMSHNSIHTCPVSHI